jgi:hypothetical protein
MATGQPTNLGTMPCPDIQQPIMVRSPDGRFLCDPVWYRFFRSPQFIALSTGGGTGTGGGAPTPAPVMTQGQGASSVLVWLNG